MQLNIYSIESDPIFSQPEVTFRAGGTIKSVTNIITPLHFDKKGKCKLSSGLVVSNEYIDVYKRGEYFYNAKTGQVGMSLGHLNSVMFYSEYLPTDSRGSSQRAEMIRLHFKVLKGLLLHLGYVKKDLIYK